MPVLPPPESVDEAPVAAARGEYLTDRRATPGPHRLRLWKRWRRVGRSVATSTVTHIGLIVLLAQLSWEGDSRQRAEALVASTVEKPDVEAVETQRFELPEDPQLVSDAAAIFELLDEPDATTALTAEEFAETAALSFSRSAGPIGFERFDASELTAVAGALSGVSGRSGATRQELLIAGGGSEASEAAVAHGLAWIAAHQLEDGSWRFDHRGGECQGRCRHPGFLNRCTTGATGLALLPMLGAGHTHQQGDYLEAVEAGLAYLMSRMQRAPFGGSLVESGGLYDHGIGTIVLCEAYAMTGDSWLREAAQNAIDFIVYAQDPRGGGWRYQPKMRGDTSVVGWQLMALKSAQMAGLEVPSSTLAGVTLFLDSVQTKRGAAYGYTDPGYAAGTNSIGLLCRMYLGWERDAPALVEGVETVARHGASSTDVYYNYYATQLMHHFGGELWEEWNAEMRDALIATQRTQGHERGSWYTEDPGQASQLGGRLYTTALSILTLEVYYRHLPIYDQKSLEVGF